MKHRGRKFLVLFGVASIGLLMCVIVVGAIFYSRWGKMTPDLAEYFFAEKHPGCTIVEFKSRKHSDVAEYIFEYRKPNDPSLYEETGRFEWGDGVWSIDWAEPRRIQ